MGRGDVFIVTAGDRDLLPKVLDAASRFEQRPDDAAMQAIHSHGRLIEKRFKQVNFVLSPTLLMPPVPLGYMNTNDGDHHTYVEHIHSFWGFTHLYNATGNPAISLPLQANGTN